MRAAVRSVTPGNDRVRGDFPKGGGASARPARGPSGLPMSHLAVPEITTVSAVSRMSFAPSGPGRLRF